MSTVIGLEVAILTNKVFRISPEHPVCYEAVVKEKSIHKDWRTA